MNRRALSTVAYLLAAHAASALLAQPTFTSSQIISDGRAYDRPSAAVDSQGFIHAAYTVTTGVNNTDSTTREIIYVTNKPLGGTNWAFTQVTQNSVIDDYPSLVVDANDKVHIAFETGVDPLDSVPPTKIRYVSSVNGPIAGGDAGIIDLAPAFGVDEEAIEPKIAVDASGKVWCVFGNQFGTDFDVFLVTYPPGGPASGVTNLSSSIGTDDNPTIDAGPDGLVHITYRRSRGSASPFQNSIIYLRNSGPGGALVEVPTNAGYFGGALIDVQPIALVTPKPGGQHTLTVAFKAPTPPNNSSTTSRMRFVESDTSYLFAPAPVETVLNPLGVGNLPAFYDKAAAHPDGRRFFAYAANQSASDKGTYVVAEKTPDEGGGFWDPINLRGDFTSIGNIGTSIGVSPGGTLAVVWGERTSAGGVASAIIWVSVAEVGGGSIPCPLDLSGNTIVDADDIFAFLNIWFAGPPGGACTGCQADWDGNGLITADDIFAFLNQWFAFGPGSPCP